MKKLELKNGTIYLDGEEVPCLKSFAIVSSANRDGVAELTMTLDVFIDSVSTESKTL